MFELGEGVDFQFDFHHVTGVGAGAGQGGFDAAGERDVVVLDEDGVIEAEAVVHAAAAAHRVFFGDAQAGRGFAGADDAGLGVGDGAGNAVGGAGDATEMTEKIQCDAFAGEDFAGRSAEPGDDVARADAAAIRSLDVHFDAGVDEFEGEFDQRQPGDDPGFARDEEGFGIEIRRHGRDIESLPFLEAIRQLSNELGPAQVMFVHLTLLPWIPSAGELKTKPTQHSVKELLSVGIQPHMLLCRCDRPIPDNERRKIALFCNVRPEAVIAALDVDTIYAVPISYHAEGMDREVLRHFGLPHEAQPNVAHWQRVVNIVRAPEGEVRIAVVGKYTNLLDSYKSLNEALAHGGIANRVRVHLDWVDSQIFEQPDTVARLEGVHGILVPGGFGERGTEGKIAAVQFARERRVPFFGICFGMQMAVIECARHLAGYEHASSSEFGPCDEAVVGLLTEWARGNEIEKRAADGDLGGTMRLGAYPALLAEGSLVHSIYAAGEIAERHRHRYEVNVRYRAALEEAGLRFSGMSPDGVLPEIVERTDHPWFIGVQFHPELKSKPLVPHPLFSAFIAASVRQSRLV